MTDFNYKKYSLEKLEEWMHDSMSCDETTPQDIFDVIKGVVEENYYHHKHHTGRAYELLALLNGNGKGHLSCNKDDTSPECKGAWNSFWEENYYPEEVKDDCMPPWGHSDMEALSKQKEDKVVKWCLPVQEDPSGEYFVSFPDDLLEATNLKEGDEVVWEDNKNGTYTLRKITRPLRMDEC
jgi:hypothetical protein